jgi:ribose transport system ATP-binding protein
MTDERPTALMVTGATKRFGNALALDNVNLGVARASICALLGANGSGKSTLIRALAGYHLLDSGVVAIHGEQMNSHRLAEQGRAAGLRFVHQDLALIPDLSIMDNLALERGYVRDGVGGIRWRREEERVRRELRSVGVEASPRERVAHLGPVDRTLVAIARALDHLDLSRSILVLDEPTARLPQSEAAKLLARLAALKERGLPIVYVTHRLDEVYKAADAVTVLRDGREAFSGPLSTLGGDDLRQLITGGAVRASRPIAASGARSAPRAHGVVLEVDNVSSQRLKNLSLKVHRGEILGVTGLIGSGRSELGRIVYGLQARTGGDVRVNGKPVDGGVASRGIGYIPQDRRAGLFPGLSVQENITITAADRLNQWYGLSPKRVRDAAMQVIRSFQIRPADPTAPVGILSGGNQQKVALGKWLQLPLELVILDEPTQAIDIGTKQDLMTTIKERARAEGLAVLWLESDIDELVKYTDRIIVMNAGRISAEFAEPPFSLPEVLAEAYRMNDDSGEEKGDAAHAARIEHGA